MTRKEITSWVIIMIAEQVGSHPDDITESTILYNDLGMDSLDQIEGVLSVEKHYEINIPNDEVEAIKTIGQLTDQVEKQLNLKNNERS